MPHWKRNLIILWFSQILSLMGFNFVLPFLPYYIQDLGIRDPDQLRLWTGIITAAPSLSFAIISPIWGIAADRWGKKLMILRAMLAGGILMMLYSLCTTVQAVTALRVIQGLFTGTIAASTTLVAAGTPQERLSYALGFLSSSNFIGTSMGPLIGGICAESFGFHTTFIIGGVILFVGAVIVALHVKEIDESIPLTSVSEKEQFPLSELLSKPFLTLFILLFLLRVARNIAQPFIPLYIQEVQGTMKGAPSLMGLISGGAGLLTALSGVTLVRLGDTRPRERLLKNLFLISAITALPIGLMRSLLGFTGFFFLSSYFMGGIEPIIQSAMSVIAPRNRKGLVFGVQTSVGSLGLFVAPLMGSFVSIHFGIKDVFITLSLMLFFSWLVSEILFRRFLPTGVKGFTNREKPV
ncbi:MAG: MFS transporter [Spirochaetales bacterium]|nr:MFS transporter [Spirochaetales bacterium]